MPKRPAAPGLPRLLAAAACAMLLLGLSAAAATAADQGLQIVEQVSFPAADGSYGLTVRATGIAEGTTAFTPNTRIVLEFDDLRTMVACLKPKDKHLPDGCNLPAAFNTGSEAAVTGIAARFADDQARLIGPHQVTLRVGRRDATTDPQTGVKTDAMAELTGSATVVFSAVGYDTPRWIAVIVTAALLGIVVLLLRAGGRPTLPNGTRIGLLQAAFLDSDTSTYSLSKLQFYIWSFAIISGYLYLTIARSMVQGSLELAEVPANLPMLLAISVGTSVAAVGVSSLAGGKGAGDFHPSVSDLITSGGVVAPERLQHLLWSIIGAGGFLVFSYAISPATIATLPAVPDGFVQLMGLSAAGYVAGKVARGPGPNIRSVIGTRDAAAHTIRLTVDGTNMDVQGSFLLAAPGGQDTPVSAKPGAASVLDNNGKTASRLVFDAVPQPVVGPPSPPPTGAAPGATPSTTPPAPSWRFTVVNQDGEKAVWEFQPT
ncbi:MAG: hypothetical protein P4L71_00765 [Acetobacteraceae bacterium]|nr:hypothetical protein [Acetobacteraceae bacterium]